jgi:hypothetical protein
VAAPAEALLWFKPNGSDKSPNDQTLRVFRRGAPALASAFGLRALQRRYPLRVKPAVAKWNQRMEAKDYFYAAEGDFNHG